jgi:hypothetical protein
MEIVFLLFLSVFICVHPWLKNETPFLQTKFRLSFRHGRARQEKKFLQGSGETISSAENHFIRLVCLRQTAGRNNLIRQQAEKGYVFPMSYLTLEVEIEQGKITPSEPTQLPQKGKGLLTVLEAEPESAEMAEIQKMTPRQAFHALQKSLNLDAAKAKAWMDLIRDARR